MSNGNYSGTRTSTFSSGQRGEFQQVYNAKKFAADMERIHGKVEEHYEDVTSMSGIPVVGDMLSWGESLFKGEPDINWSEDVHQSAWLPQDVTQPMKDDVDEFISDAESAIDNAALTELITDAAFVVTGYYAPQLLPLLGDKGVALQTLISEGLLSKGWKWLLSRIGGSVASPEVLYNVGYTTGGFV